MYTLTVVHVWIMRLGMLAIIIFAIFGCDGGGTSIPNKFDNFLFDPFALKSEPLQRSMLTPAPSSEGSTPIPGAESVLTDPNALFELANELAHEYEPSTLLSSVSFNGFCQRYQEGVSWASFDYSAANVGPDELYSHETSTILISIRNGSLLYMSDYVPGVDESLFHYPPAISYRRAMQIAQANGGEEAEQRIGATCEFRARLNGDVWTIYWYVGRVWGSEPVLTQEIDANTGEVRKVERKEEKIYYRH
ncbi:MAG: hypothetical protein D6694_13475 [Gammaproteobacteria bacterium]|nr:MAG: hypothetical protein D6694_13475 [Gammaproteobacteria bacterium]